MSNSSQEQDQEGDVLARLAEAFADLSVPMGPSAAVKERLLVSLGQRSAQPATVRSVRTWRNVNMRKALSAAVFLVAATAMAAAWIPRPGGAGSAFAEMLRQIQEIRTVSFQMSVDMKEFPDEFPLETRLTAMDPGWLRTEVLIGGRRAVMISNYSQQKQLVLFPETKQALLRPIKNATAMQGKNYVQSLRNLQEQHAKFVGDDQIDGKPALKYDYQRRGDSYTLWLDATTKLPVRIESASGQKPSEADVHMTMSDFVWNVEVNEADFSLELPAGYEMTSVDALGGTPSG